MAGSEKVLLSDSQVENLYGALRRINHPAPENLVERVRPLLQMPDSLAGVCPIAQNLGHLLPRVQKLLPGEEGGGAVDVLREWHDALSAIPRGDPLWSGATHLYREDKPGERVQHPFTGILTTHPVWCALWYVHDDAEGPEPDTYKWLQAHLLAAHILLYLRGLRPRHDQHPYHASRVVRWAHEPTFRWLILKVRHVREDPRRLAETLLEIKEQASPSDSQPAADKRQTLITQYGGYLAEIMALAHDLPFRGISERTRTGRSGGQRTGSPRGRDVDAMEPDHHGFQHHQDNRLLQASWGTDEYRANRHVPSEEHQNELLTSGLAPEEYEVDEGAEITFEAILGHEPGEDRTPLDLKDLPPLGSVYARARSIGRRIAMESQRFRVELRRIRLTQLHRILQTLEAVFSEASVDGPHDEPASRREERNKRRETVLLAAIALVTGSPPDTVRRTQCVDGISQLPAEFKLAYNPGYRMWMRPYNPPPRHPLAQEERKQAIEHWPRVVFEDILGVGQHLNRTPSDRKTQRHFTHNESTYEKLWDSHIVPRLKQAGVEPRWRQFKNLATIMPSWFAWAEEGQHLAPALLFGTDDPLARTHHFYTAWERGELARIYHEHLETALAGSGLDEERDHSYERLWNYRAPGTAIPESWTGNDRLPRAESISDLIAELSGRLHSQGPPHRRDAAGWLNAHNLMTAYTALGLTLAVGGRAIRTPVPDLSARHHATGTIALQEKDRSDGSHARLVVLPPEVIQQIEAYMEHLVVLFTTFPGLPTSLTCPATKHRDRSAYQSDQYELALRSTCFFLDAGDPEDPTTWVPVELTGRRLREECNRVLPAAWPLDNAGRHLLRSYLTAQGCPATIINTHLGHWSYGEEPWGAPSAFDPVRYRKAIRPYLDRLMQDIGYRVVAP